MTVFTIFAGNLERSDDEMLPRWDFRPTTAGEELETQLSASLGSGWKLSIMFHSFCAKGWMVRIWNRWANHHCKSRSNKCDETITSNNILNKSVDCFHGHRQVCQHLTTVRQTELAWRVDTWKGTIQENPRKSALEVESDWFLNYTILYYVETNWFGFLIFEPGILIPIV